MSSVSAPDVFDQKQTEICPIISATSRTPVPLSQFELLPLPVPPLLSPFSAPASTVYKFLGVCVPCAECRQQLRLNSNWHLMISCRLSLSFSQLQRSLRTATARAVLQLQFLALHPLPRWHFWAADLRPRHRQQRWQRLQISVLWPRSIGCWNSHALACVATIWRSTCSRSKAQSPSYWVSSRGVMRYVQPDQCNQRQRNTRSKCVCHVSR